MQLPQQVIDELTVEPGRPAHLHRRSTATTTARWLPAEGPDARRMAEEDLATFRQELAGAQERLYAADSWSVLVVLQALDAAGKDGTIKHVMSGVNPQGCSVVPFAVPSAQELAHDFLWRYVPALPGRGRIGIFNRSYYEEVLVARVHPEVLAARHLPADHPTGEGLWRQRFEDINAFEHHLVRNGTRIVKLYLHVSPEEQRRRLLDRLDEPDKWWKFSPADLAERAHLDEYRAAYEEAITATSTEWAPWRVVPADHKYALRALVGGILVHEIGRLDLHRRQPSPDERAALDAARQALTAET